MICKNCTREASGHFCSHCGQKSAEPPVTLAYFSQQLLSKINPLQAGNATLLSFLLHPAQTIVDFIQCKRMQIAQPLSVLFVTSGIYLLFNAYLGDHTLKAHIAATDSRNIVLIKYFLQSFYQNLGFSLLLTSLPFAWLTHISFKWAGYRYAEHVAIQLYLVSYGLVLSVLQLMLEHWRVQGFSLMSPTLFTILFYTVLGLVFSKVMSAEYHLQIVVKYLLLMLLFIVLLTMCGVAFLWLQQGIF